MVVCLRVTVTGGRRDRNALYSHCSDSRPATAQQAGGAQLAQGMQKTQGALIQVKRQCGPGSVAVGVNYYWTISAYYGDCGPSSFG